MAGQEYLLKTVLQLKDNLSKPMQEIRKRMSAFGRSVREVTSASSDLMSMIGKPFAVLAGAGGFSVSSAISSYVELADSIDKASIRAGVAASDLQRLRYAAKNSGMGAEEMDAALAKLTSSMAKAAAGGNDNLLALFRHLGISLRDSRGNIRSAADVMRNLAQAVQANESPAARMQMLSIAFGDKMAERLIPLLASGADGLKKFGDRAEELGLVMSDKDVAAANAFGDKLGELGDVAKTVSTSIGAKLAPAFDKLIPKLEDIVIKYRELIATNVQKFVESFAKELDKIDWERTINGFFETVRRITEFIEAIGGVSTLVKAFGVLVGVNLVLKAAAFVKAVSGMVVAVRMLGAAAVANPIVAILGVIAGLAFVLYENWEPILNWFEEKLDSIAKFMGRVFGGFKQFFSGIGNPMNAAPSPVLAGAAQGAASTTTASGLPLPPGFVGVDEGVNGKREVETKSDITLRLIADPGTHARTEGMTSSGPVNLTTEYGYGAD